MSLIYQTPRQALNKAFLKVKPLREDISNFKDSVKSLLENLIPNNEQHNAAQLKEFLNKIYYQGNEQTVRNFNGYIDLAIRNSNSRKSKMGVIFEIKNLQNDEMISIKHLIEIEDNIEDINQKILECLNKKALQELVLYYMRERISNNNIEIKHLIVTNCKEWFIFDATIFDKLLAQDKEFLKTFKQFSNRQLAITTTESFYSDIAKPHIEKIKHLLKFTYFNFETIDKNDNSIISLYKILAPENLLKLPFVNDSNTLNKEFYSELLYIMGLEEIRQKNKKIIQRCEKKKRQLGTLLEDTIIQLESTQKLSRIANLKNYGIEEDEQYFNIALELTITWINRILFLKLLEGQVVSYRNSKEYAFLNTERIKTFNNLNTLFFQVLAVKPASRNEDVKVRFPNIPYLNSSLFEPTELEHQALFLSNLNGKKIRISPSTVLKDNNGSQLEGELTTIDYLLMFLDAYDFASEGTDELQDSPKTLINASVLGLIFEKINGYKDGSYFTPGFITMYMCRETIRRAVIQKFNDSKNWNCQSFDDLKENIFEELRNSNNRKGIREFANKTINSLKICDPAVGSGHFLVSALNEIIAIKSELRVLADTDFNTLNDWIVSIENDELLITDMDGNIFQYKYLEKQENQIRDDNSQKIQEIIFHEKQTIIENCLFGVDINPNSVKICRLRLWIELLKNAYYTKESGYKELETLPNIDINIKCGNSLVSRYTLDVDIKAALKKSNWTVDAYKLAVMNYRNAKNKNEKREMESLIEQIKRDFEFQVSSNDKRVQKLSEFNDKLKEKTTQTTIFELNKKEKANWEKEVNKLSNEIDKLKQELEDIKSNRIYENSLEWRFEFPEVLNDDGEFIGFDVIIGNPPWGVKLNTCTLEHVKRNNQDIIIRTVDTYMFFINRALNLKRKNGFICKIIPDVLLYQIDNEKLRKKILAQNNLLIVGNIRDNIFDGVIRPSCILLLGGNLLQRNIKLFEYKNDASLSSIDHTSTIISPEYFSELPLCIFATRNFSGYNLLKRIKGERLEKLIDNDGIQRGISPDVQEIFVVDINTINSNQLEEEFLYPTITGGRDLIKYLAKDIGKKIIYTESSVDKKKIKNIIKYISKHKHKITCKEVTSGRHTFWALHRSRNREIFEKESKIMGVLTNDRISVSIDKFKIFPTDGIYVMSSNGKFSNEFLVGLLNAKLITFLYRLYSLEEDRTLAQINPSLLKLIPIPDFDNNIQKIIEEKVDKILIGKENGENTSILEAEIDILVYLIYGLTQEEIDLVESGT